MKRVIFLLLLFFFILNSNNSDCFAEKEENFMGLKLSNRRYTIKSISKGYDVRKLRWGMTLEQALKADSFPRDEKLFGSKVSMYLAFSLDYSGDYWLIDGAHIIANRQMYKNAMRKMRQRGEVLTLLIYSTRDYSDAKFDKTAKSKLDQKYGEPEVTTIGFGFRKFDIQRAKHYPELIKGWLKEMDQSKVYRWKKNENTTILMPVFTEEKTQFWTNHNRYILWKAGINPGIIYINTEIYQLLKADFVKYREYLANHLKKLEGSRLDESEKF